MSKYLVSIKVKSVEGTQFFEVEAEDEKKAKDELMDGKGEFYSEELEVKELDWNSIKVIDRIDR